MSKGIHLHHQDWLVPVVVLGLIVWFLFVFKEFYGTKKLRIINCLVSLFLIASICAVILKPEIGTPLKTKNVIVLTEGFDQRHLDSLQNSNKKIEIVSYRDDEALSFKVEPDTIFILGNGIETYDLWQLKNRSVYFLPNDVLRGINKFKYTKEVSLGKDISFRGMYSNPVEGNKLILKNEVGIPVDSVLLNSFKSQKFRFATRPKLSGRFLYSVEEIDTTGKVINSDPVPIIVKEPLKLNILIMNSFPNFESKYLKSYLAESGHHIVVRNRISRGKFKYEFLNRDKIPFFTVNNLILQATDLIITDEQELQSLSKKDRNLIRQEIKTNGLGIFIQQDDNFYYNSGLLDRFGYTFDNVEESEIMLSANESQIVSKAPRVFRTDNVVPLIKNTKDEVVTAYYKIEKGSVGSTLLRETYALQLKGEDAFYKELWSSILENIAKKAKKSVSFNSKHFLAYKNEPFQFSVIMNEPNELWSTNGNYYIPLKNDWVIREKWKGVVYPKDKGWEKIQIKNDTTLNTSIYVTDTLNWQTLKTKEKIQANMRLAGVKKREESELYPTKSLNLFWLYGFILLSIGYLWLIPKIRNN